MLPPLFRFHSVALVVLLLHVCGFGFAEPKLSDCVYVCEWIVRYHKRVRQSGTWLKLKSLVKCQQSHFANVVFVGAFFLCYQVVTQFVLYEVN